MGNSSDKYNKETLVEAEKKLMERSGLPED